MRYLTWVQTGKRQGHFVGALVTTLLVGYAFFWSIKYLHDPAADDIYDPATSALKAYFYIATGAFSLLLMWGLYAVLHFWPTLIVEHVYTLLGYFVGFRLSISDGRIAPLLRGQWFVDRYAEMLAVRDDCVGANATATAALLASGCRSATISRESGTAVILVCGFAWLAGYGGLRPGTFLLLLHLTVGWYLLARAGLDDLDSFPGAAYQDSVFLYMYLLILYLNLRRADAHTRAEFLWIEFLEAKTENQAACAARRARHTPDWPTRARAGCSRAPPPCARCRRLQEVESQITRLQPAALDPQQQRVLAAALGEMSADLRRVQLGYDDLTIGARLGEGNFAEVNAAVWLGTPCAVKRLKRARITPAGLEAFEEEVLLRLDLAVSSP